MGLRREDKRGGRIELISLLQVCKEALRKNEEKTKKRDMDALRKIKRADVEEVEVEEEGESKEKEEKGEEGEAEKEAKKLKTET